MSKCYLTFDDGHLTCTVDHRDFKNCDLYKKEQVTQPNPIESEHLSKEENQVISDHLFELMDEPKTELPDLDDTAEIRKVISKVIEHYLNIVQPGSYELSANFSGEGIDEAIAQVQSLLNKARLEDLTPNQQLLEQNKRLIEAGDALYERASYTGREFDGTHRLLSAAAHWLDVRGKNSGQYQAELEARLKSKGAETEEEEFDIEDHL